MSVAGGSVSPLDYHHATKHTFSRFARSMGYLDWASQPSPFRRYSGAPVRELPRDQGASSTPYDALYSGGAESAPLSLVTLGEFLRCSLGLSAWKAYAASRWALRVNPSSGNLHPTEGYIVWEHSLFHYAPAEHALEQRAVFPQALAPQLDASFLVALTSIHWREAWKYGERAFRYCQHDVGHALGALRIAAAMLGWRMTLMTSWPHLSLATVLGLDRADDFGDAEREEPDLIAQVTCGPQARQGEGDVEAFLRAARAGVWTGRANRLSARHVDWPLIEEVARSTAYPGFEGTPPVTASPLPADEPRDAPPARTIILQRRSATEFNPRGLLRRDVFISMLHRLDPVRPPWDVVWWPPQVHLALFIHRVQDLHPGIYAYLRREETEQDWRAGMRPDFLWEPVRTGDGTVDGLFLLAPVDVRQTANRISCDQDIAGDGFFSCGMLARMAGLQTYGAWFYRHLFWECGLIGQVLYLEAEAAGARSTGIGCYYDDPVHEVLGLQGNGWQSLYHFSMGLPVDDPRLTTESGYAWEATEGRGP